MKAQRLGRERMLELQTAGMQTQPITGNRRNLAIQRVSEDGMPQSRQMHPQLMGTAGPGVQLQPTPDAMAFH